MMYTLAGVRVEGMQVPAGAHIPMMYTGRGNLECLECVPAGAHIPMMYTKLAEKGIFPVVPAGAHIPMMYTDGDEEEGC